MFIGYTPEQERLRQELREYFATLMTPERRAALASGGDYGDGAVYKEVVRQMGADGWLTLSWPEQYGGRGASMLDQLIFTDEAAIAGAPVPFLTINTVGPTIMRFGTRRAEGVLPAEDRVRRAALLDRLQRARRRHRPRVAAHPRRARRRRVGRQRPEDVDEPDPVRRLRLARLPHRSRRAAAQGPVDPHRADRRADGFSWTPVHTMSGPTTSATYYSDVRVPGGVGRRRGERRLAADHQPAQPRAGRADLGRADPRPRCARCASGRSRPSSPTAAA